MVVQNSIIFANEPSEWVKIKLILFLTGEIKIYIFNPPYARTIFTYFTIISTSFSCFPLGTVVVRQKAFGCTLEHTSCQRKEKNLSLLMAKKETESHDWMRYPDFNPRPSPCSVCNLHFLPLLQAQLVSKVFLRSQMLFHINFTNCVFSCLTLMSWW